MSEYSELIKNYNKIRNYIRDFYIYGFRSREEYGEKSSRSYDNEKRRIESYLKDIVSFRQEDDGKKVFLTVDSGELFLNPFYKSFKAKSFTKNDITLHFAVLYVLKKYGTLTLSEISEHIEKEIFDFFDSAEETDIATLRNKLKEYESLGIVRSGRIKGKACFSLSDSPDLSSLAEAIAFFSENFPVGAVGSFILDGCDAKNNFFTSKHRYLADVVDSDVICELLGAVDSQKQVTVTSYTCRKSGVLKNEIIPLKLAFMTQTGRNYLMGYSLTRGHFLSLRIDNIKEISVSPLICAEFKTRQRELEEKLGAVWGAYLDDSQKVKRLKAYVFVGDGEEYVLNRLRREKRGGRLEQIEKNLYCLTLETYDLNELTPWLRTFIGRIQKVEASDARFVKKFYSDLEEMRKLYEDEEK